MDVGGDTMVWMWDGFRFDIGFIVTTIGGYGTNSQVPPITSSIFLLYLQF